MRGSGTWPGLANGTESSNHHESITRSETMSEKNRDERSSETDLQEELRRESAEVADAIGDIAADRNVSGSSTWTTLPEETPEQSD
jgi:hypothetical protein